MKKTKRLFLFAGYDKDGIIDDTLVHYLTELSKLGDIILVMDCDVDDTSKLENINNLLYVETKRHNEYDFGSYKRGYIWAHDNKILNKYDWVYLVNDSVYGPLYPLDNVLNTLEQGSEAVGMIGVVETDIVPRHIQSWFIGLKKNIAKSKPVSDFLYSVTALKTKQEIISKYEMGFSRMILSQTNKVNIFMKDFVSGALLYKTPIKALAKQLPFIKKCSIEQLSDPSRLYAFTTYYNLIDNILSKISNVSQEKLLKNSKIGKYVKIMHFYFCGIPIVSVYKKTPYDIYKIMLFGIIPIFMMRR